MTFIFFDTEGDYRRERPPLLGGKSFYGVKNLSSLIYLRFHQYKIKKLRCKFILRIYLLMEQKLRQMPIGIRLFG